MPLKAYRNEAPPQPKPPDTYSLEGMSLVQKNWLHNLLVNTANNESLLKSVGEQLFYTRAAALLGQPHGRVKGMPVTEVV